MVTPLCTALTTSVQLEGRGLVPGYPGMQMGRGSGPGFRPLRRVLFNVSVALPSLLLTSCSSPSSSLILASLSLPSLSLLLF